MFHIIDDGTLDTVVECGFCDLQERFDSVELLANLPAGTPHGLRSHFRIISALAEAEQDHECPIFADETGEDCAECGHIHNADGSCGLVAGCECNTALATPHGSSSPEESAFIRIAGAAEKMSKPQGELDFIPEENWQPDNSFVLPEGARFVRVPNEGS